MPGPLAGMRVLDLSAIVSGPYTAALLGDLGADVIKVEKPGPGDFERTVGSKRNGFSGLFHMFNRGKRALAVDLGAEEGRAIIERLAQETDVVVQNFRPGVVDRLGIGYKQLSEINDQIVYLSITGFGTTGPKANNRVYDPVIQSYAGFTWMQGRLNEDEPMQVNQFIVDKLTAHTACEAVLAALLARSRTGKGQHIELSMLDAAIAFIWPECGSDHILLGDEIDHRPPSGAAGRLLQFADGWATTIALNNDEIFGMFRAMGMAEVEKDPRFADAAGRRENREAWREQMAALRARQREMPVREAERRFAEEGAPFGRVLSFDELPDDPQIRENGIFFEREHPVAGPMRETRPAAVFSATPSNAGKHAPQVGEDTREILEEIGMGDRFLELLKKGIVAVPGDA